MTTVDSSLKRILQIFAILFFVETSAPLAYASLLSLETSQDIYQYEDTLIVIASIKNTENEPTTGILEYTFRDLRGKISTAKIALPYNLKANETIEVELINLKIDEQFYTGQYLVSARIIENGMAVDEREIRFNIEGALEDLNIRILISSDSESTEIARTFILKEKIYISFSGAPEDTAITANLRLPDNKTIKVNLPTNITSKMAGVYTIELKASAQGYRDFSTTEYFAVLEKSLDILHDSKENSSITIKLDKTKLNQGDEITITGKITPSHADTLVTLTYFKDGVIDTTRNTTTDDEGKYRDIHKIQASGEWIVKASWQGDSNHFEAESQKVNFNVQAPRDQNYLIIIALIIISAILILILKSRALI